MKILFLYYTHFPDRALTVNVNLICFGGVTERRE